MGARSDASSSRHLDDLPVYVAGEPTCQEEDCTSSLISPSRPAQRDVRRGIDTPSTATASSRSAWNPKRNLLAIDLNGSTASLGLSEASVDPAKGAQICSHAKGTPFFCQSLGHPNQRGFAGRIVDLPDITVVSRGGADLYAQCECR